MDIHRVLVEKSARDHLQDPGADGKIILKWIFKRWDDGRELDRSGSLTPKLHLLPAYALLCQ